MARTYGQKSSIGTSAVAAVGSATPLDYGVVVKALAGNSGTVYVGFDSSVTSSTGFPLAAGEVMFFEVAALAGRDLAALYLIGSASGQAAAYFAY